MRTKGNNEARWTLRLKASFPELFQDISPWGFGCESGWEILLTQLCGRLDALALLELRVVQVKEKYGTLRFYVHGSTDEVQAMIRQAEAESAKTCEWCGAPGQMRESERRYFLTLCPPCFEKWASNGWVMASPRSK